MDFDKAIELQEMYSACPNCNSNKVSEGKMKFLGDTFHRSCKCGFTIDIDVNEIEGGN